MAAFMCWQVLQDLAGAGAWAPGVGCRLGCFALHCGMSQDVAGVQCWGLTGGVWAIWLALRAILGAHGGIMCSVLCSQGGPWGLP